MEKRKKCLNGVGEGGKCGYLENGWFMFERNLMEGCVVRG